MAVDLNYNKANVSLMIASEVTLVSEDRNLASVINIFEDVETKSFPHLIPQLSVLTSLSTNNVKTAPKQFEFIIYLDDVSKTLFKAEIEPQFERNNENQRIIININGLIIPESGELFFSFWDKKHEVYSYSVPAKENSI